MVLYGRVLLDFVAVFFGKEKKNMDDMQELLDLVEVKYIDNNYQQWLEQACHNLQLIFINIDEPKVHIFEILYKKLIIFCFDIRTEINIIKEIKLYEPKDKYRLLSKKLLYGISLIYSHSPNLCEEFLNWIIFLRSKNYIGIQGLLNFTFNDIKRMWQDFTTNKEKIYGYTYYSKQLIQDLFLFKFKLWFRIILGLPNELTCIICEYIFNDIRWTLTFDCPTNYENVDL